MAVTSIEQLTAMAQGEEVNLPPFVEGQEFVAKLRRPSLYAMVKAGKLPNSLLVHAEEVFGSKSKDKTAGLGELYDALIAVCEAAFVSPTYAEIKANGIELTDEQMMAVFSYTQEGARALEQFRSQSADIERTGDGETVSETPIGNN